MTPPAEFDRLRAEARDRHGRGDAEGALLALYRALALRRDDLACEQMLCRILYESPAAFAAAPWELVGIHDARSLAEGYTRGLQQSRGKIVVFSHDDIGILSPDLGSELARALDAVDVVGVVGATRLAGPAFAWGGKAFTRGQIAEPALDGTVQLVIFNPTPGITGGLAAVDGVFMAARRETVEAVGFDAATFDGFHLYDIDFSYRAHRAGYRVGVSAAIVVRHDSPGGFDARWEAYAQRFLAKFPEVRGERFRNVMSRIPFRSADELLAYCRRLEEAGRRALGA
jgi:GT2 family glycosyltransferase